MLLIQEDYELTVLHPKHWTLPVHIIKLISASLKTFSSHIYHKQQPSGGKGHRVASHRTSQLMALLFAACQRANQYMCPGQPLAPPAVRSTA